MSTFLNADPLVSNLCTVGDYVIEWRWNSRDGEVVFVSGHGTDPAIQAQHPIVNEVVLAGTLYPVIRYAYLNGMKYTLNYEDGALLSPDFKYCLDPVVVEAINCSTIQGSDLIYPYTLNYINTVDGGLNRSRLLKYDIAADTVGFAWSFYAATVADQMKIYYCTLADPDGVLLENYINGINYVTPNFYPTNYPTNPKITSASWTQTSPMTLVTSLSAFTYQAGDYIKIEIIGSVYEPTNYNTNWTVKFKCITAAEISCTWYYDTGISKIDSTPVMSYVGDPTCIYKVEYNTVDTWAGLPSKNIGIFLYKYFSGFIYAQAFNPAQAGFTNPSGIGVRWNEKGTTVLVYYPAGTTTCVNLDSGHTITATKDTSQIVYTFSHSVDYDKYVSDIAAWKASSAYTTWLGLTDQDIRYYGGTRTVFYVGNSCGDVLTTYVFYYWAGCPIAYDADLKTITITYTIPTNAIVDTSCSDVYEMINNRISDFTYTKNFSFPGGSLVTHVTTQSLLYMQWPGVQSNHETTMTSYLGIAIEEGLFNTEMCDLSALGFCKNIYTPTTWFAARFYDRLTLTSPETHESRLACWKLERKKFLRTDVCTDTDWEVVYEATTTTTTTTSTSSTTTTTTTEGPTTTTTTTSTSTTTTSTSTTTTSTSTTTTTSTSTTTTTTTTEAPTTSTTTTTHTTVLDPGQNIPWGITRVGGPGDYMGSASVWVLDSGIDLDHPDLNVDQVRGVSFIVGNPSPDDDEGHGSHVAGIVGAINNTFGVIGVAPGVLLVPIKVLDNTGSGTFSGVLAGINYLAANGQPGDVATMSFGGGISPTIDAAVLAASANVKIAIAAGNEAEDVNIHSPARQEGSNIYTVAYMANGDTWGALSNYGMPTIDYIAPGQSIYSTYKNGGYASLSGTSMAAPHVAGILLYGDVHTDGYVTHNGVNYPIAHI